MPTFCILLDTAYTHDFCKLLTVVIKSTHTVNAQKYNYCYFTMYFTLIVKFQAQNKPTSIF